MRKLLAIVVLLVFATVAQAADVTVAWDANTEPDLDGYKIFYGTVSGTYLYMVDVGNVLEYTLTGLAEGVEYFFAAKAYDTNDNESGYSEEISYIIPVTAFIGDIPNIRKK